MRDIDLSILASTKQEYRNYTLSIRKEYAHVSDRDFKTGRSAILEHFLAGPIFATEAFSDCESVARANLESECNELILRQD